MILYDYFDIRSYHILKKKGMAESDFESYIQTSGRKFLSQEDINYYYDIINDVELNATVTLILIMRGLYESMEDIINSKIYYPKYKADVIAKINLVLDSLYQKQVNTTYINKYITQILSSLTSLSEAISQTASTEDKGPDISDDENI